MPQRTLTEISEPVPEGYAVAYTTSEFARMEPKFKKRNHQRHNHLFYDAVAEPLRDGTLIPFPLGPAVLNWPCGISFTFEKVKFLVVLPEPSSSVTAPFICTTDNGVQKDHVLRAAHHFADLFVEEYRRFYATALKHEQQLTPA